MSDFPTVVPAATIVIFRHDPAGGPAQLLMVQRAKDMRFAGGAAVFPGGRVDEADCELAARLLPDADQADAAARIAALRETLEETGLALALDRPIAADEARAAREFLLEQGAFAPVLERFGWRIDPLALTPFAHWCPRWEGAFDTRFFLADLGTGAVDVTVDATENTRLFWASANEVLARADSGDLHVIFPTRRNVERLAQFASFVEARDHALATPMQRITPGKEIREGEDWLVIPDGLGYPITGQPIRTVSRG